MKNQTATAPGGLPVDPSHSKPGDGVARTPGGTPWVPGGAPTGTPAPTPGPSSGIKPPGWFPTYLQVLAALVSNPNFDPKHGLDESLLDLAEQLTDRLLARYPAEFAK